MGNIVIPNRPLGTDQRQIAHILDDFDAILAQANGNLESDTNVKVGVVPAALTGAASAEGSSDSLARADHTHVVRAVELLASEPVSGHFEGRVYFNTTSERLFVCLDPATPVYREAVMVPESAPGAGTIPYANASAAVAFTDAPNAGEALFWDGSTLAWKPTPAARVHRTTAEVETLTPAQRTLALIAVADSLPELAEFHDGYMTAWHDAQGDPLDQGENPNGRMTHLHSRLSRLLFGQLERWNRMLERLRDAERLGATG